MELFATCPTGVADLLAEELRAIGAETIRELRGGVAFRGTLETAYRACLWSRTASRVLMAVGDVPAENADELYAGIRAIDWSQHVAPDGSIAIDVVGTNEQLTHSRFTAQRVKDGIVDAFRARHGCRPRVDLRQPDLRINVRVRRGSADVAIDLAGESLHRRGYRRATGAAPLKENLAAAVLLRSGWPHIAAEGGALVDPMCGSGTFVIEAALIAGEIAPGLLRDSFGFERWRGHDRSLHRRLLEEAAARRRAASATSAPLIGYDRDARAITAATENAARAGLAGNVRFERREFEAVRNDLGRHGLVVVNPPYGERIGDRDQLRDLYAALGGMLRNEFDGWQFALLTGNPPLARSIGMRARRSHTLFNGPIECRLLRFQIDAAAHEQTDPQLRRRERLAAARARPGAQMFANRLRKNLRTLGRWAQRAGIDCFRVYDADMPEYAFAIDLYGDGSRRWAYLQEYEAPDTVDAVAANARRLEVLAVLPEVLEVAPTDIEVRLRRQQKKGTQYERRAATSDFHVVREGRFRYYVNFTDYLDTGLFLDHRPMRGRIATTAGGMRFLNLFAYTGTMTVCAAGAGAAASTTVDLSATYLAWAQRNLELNALAAPRHMLVRADCRQWLDAAIRHGERYDLIFLDPPTHSRSKRMRTDFEVQRDHVTLLRRAAALLARNGLMIFSCNYTRFRLDRAALADLEIEDITAATIPRDFARSPRVHQCFEVRSGAPRQM